MENESKHDKTLSDFGLSQALTEALLQCFFDSMYARSQTVERKPKPFGQLLSKFYFCPPLFLIILKYDFLAFGVQVFHALFQALKTALVGRVRRRRRRFWIRLSYIFKEDILRNSTELICRVSYVGGRDLRNLAAYSVYCFVRQFFSYRTSSARKQLDEPRSDKQVLLAGAITILVKPGEKPVKLFFS